MTITLTLITTKLIILSTCAVHVSLLVPFCTVLCMNQGKYLLVSRISRDRPATLNSKQVCFFNLIQTLTHTVTQILKLWSSKKRSLHPQVQIEHFPVFYIPLLWYDGKNGGKDPAQRWVIQAGNRWLISTVLYYVSSPSFKGNNWKSMHN